MSVQADVNKVMRRLYTSDFTIEDPDVPMIRSDAETKLAAGWSVDETVKYLRCTEHVSPHLDEATALRRMAEISARVEERLR